MAENSNHSTFLHYTNLYKINIIQFLFQVYKLTNRKTEYKNTLHSHQKCYFNKKITEQVLVHSMLTSQPI